MTLRMSVQPVITLQAWRKIMTDFDVLDLAKKLRLTGIPDTLMARIEQGRNRHRALSPH